MGVLCIQKDKEDITANSSVRLVWALKSIDVTVHQEEGLLIIGDAVVGGRADIGIPDGEVDILPNRFSIKHITGIQKARWSFSTFIKYPFDAVCFDLIFPNFFRTIY